MKSVFSALALTALTGLMALPVSAQMTSESEDTLTDLEAVDIEVVEDKETAEVEAAPTAADFYAVGVERYEDGNYF